MPLRLEPSCGRSSLSFTFENTLSGFLTWISTLGFSLDTLLGRSLHWHLVVVVAPSVLPSKTPSTGFQLGFRFLTLP